jgi:hypothetical protein
MLPGNCVLREGLRKALMVRLGLTLARTKRMKGGARTRREARDSRVEVLTPFLVRKTAVRLLGLPLGWRRSELPVINPEQGLRNEQGALLSNLDLNEVSALARLRRER